LSKLLNSPEQAKVFKGGSVAVCRLAPQDYHRFHSPVDGVVGPFVDVPGTYYTVNPMAIREKVLLLLLPLFKNIVKPVQIQQGC